MASKVTKAIADVRSCIGGDALPDESRLALLQAVQDLRNDLETPFDTCHRYRYSSLDLITTRIFHNINLFDVLIESGETSISTDDLAKKTKTDPKLLGRLLRYAASIGSVKQIGEDTWTASRLSHALNEANCKANLHEASISALPYIAQLPRFFAQTNYQNPTDPVHTVHQFTHHTEGVHWYDWAKLEPNAEWYEALNTLMASHRYAKTGVEVFPFEDKLPSLFNPEQPHTAETPLFVDIGGGRGQMCLAFRAKYPDLPGRVICQDLPVTVSSAEPHDGIESMPHDFFAEQPIRGSKVYFLRHVLHNWPDAKAEALLKRVVEAMDEKSVLLLDERVLPDVGTSTFAAGLDLQMMMLVAAQERSEKDWKALLGKVGLKMESLVRYMEEEADAVMLASPIGAKGN